MKETFFHLILACLCFMPFTGKAQAGRFILNGKISPLYEGQYVMLFTFDGNNNIRTADSVVVKNGRFRFEGKAYTHTLSMLSAGNYPDKVLCNEFLLEAGTIRIDSLEDGAYTGGTPLNEGWRDYNLRQTKLYTEQKACSEAMKNTRDTVEQKRLEKKAADLRKQGDRETLEYARKNLNNVYGYSVFRSDAYIWSKKDFSMLYAAMNEGTKNLPETKEIIEGRATHERQAAMRGKPAPDFEGLTPEGKVCCLSCYTGKYEYFLIDFWASWCGPCIQEIPDIKKAYEKYKDKGLGVLTVSVDELDEAWKGALSKLDMPWPQCRAKDGIKKIYQLYNMTGIPHTLLLDRKGTIITEVFGPTLEWVLDELIKNTH